MGFVRQNGFVLGSGTFLSGAGGSGGSGGGGSTDKIYYSRVKTGGDSITLGGTGDLNVYSSNGFTGWLPSFLKHAFTYIPDPTRNYLTFSQGGQTAAEWRAAHLADMVAAEDGLSIIQLGTNDVTRGGITAAQTVAELTLIWQALVAAGNQVVILAVPPIPLSVTGNSGGAFSAKVLEWNNAYWAATTGVTGVTYLNPWTILESPVGSGIMSAQYEFGPDNLHPNALASQLAAARLATMLKQKFAFTADPLNVVANLSTNTNFAATNSGALGTSPVDYGFFSAATITAWEVRTDPDGSKWWRITAAPLVDTTYNIWNQAENVSSPTNSRVKARALLRVVSGNTITQSVQLRDEATNYFASALIYGTKSPLYPASGILPIETPDVAAGAITRAEPWINVRVPGGQVTVFEISPLSTLKTQSAPFSPAAISGLSQWFTARDASTLFNGSSVQAANGEAIATWFDKSGNARNAAQATAGSRPLKVDSGINGLASVAFNGSRNLLHTYGLPGNACTIFLVTDVATSTGYRSLFSTHGVASATQSRIYARMTNDKWGTYSVGDREANSDITGVGKVLLSFSRAAGGAVSFFLNGAADGTYAGGSTGQDGNIGGSLADTQGSISQISEVLVYNRELTPTERGTIEAGLKTLYGIP